MANFPGKRDARVSAGDTPAKSQVPKPGDYNPPKGQGFGNKASDQAFEKKKQG